MFLKSLDVISTSNCIYFRGMKSHPTKFAGMLSILAYGLVVFFLVYFSLDVFKKQNPTSYFYKKFIPDAGYFYLNTTSMFHYLQLLHANDTVIMDPDCWAVFGSDEYIDHFLEDYELDTEIHYVYDLCTKDDIVGFEDIVEEDPQFYISYCIRYKWFPDEKKLISTSDPEFVWPNIRHGTGTKGFTNQGWGAYIGRCQNTTYKKTKCKNKEAVIKEFDDNVLRIKLGMIDNDFDVTIYKAPVVPYILDTKNHLTGLTVTNNNLNFNPVWIQTDDGLVFSTNKTIYSFRLDFNEKLTYEVGDFYNKTRTLSGFYFLMTNRVETYTRRYPKFQEALANVGGFSKTILMLAAIVNYLVNQYIITYDTQITCESLGLDYTRTDTPMPKPPKEFLVNQSKAPMNNTNTAAFDKSSINNHSSLSGIPLKNNYLNNLNNKSKPGYYGETPSLINNSPTPKYMPSKEVKVQKLHHHITFGSYVKSICDSKGKVGMNIKLMNKFWISKISEENIVTMHLNLFKILQQMPLLLKERRAKVKEMLNNNNDDKLKNSSDKEKEGSIISN